MDMNESYISTDLSYLDENLKNRIILFEYRKKDGTIRRAKGTMNEDFILQHTAPHETDTWEVEVEVIDELLKVHSYNDVLEYASENDLVYVGIKGKSYVFERRKIAPKRCPIPVTQRIYFDIDRNELRSFLVDNFLGVIGYSDLNFESN